MCEAEPLITSLAGTYNIELPSYLNAKAAFEKARKSAEGKGNGDAAKIKVALDALGPAPVPPLFPMLTCPEPTLEGQAAAQAAFSAGPSAGSHSPWLMLMMSGVVSALMTFSSAIRCPLVAFVSPHEASTISAPGAAALAHSASVVASLSSPVVRSPPGRGCPGPAPCSPLPARLGACQPYRRLHLERRAAGHR